MQQAQRMRKFLPTAQRGISSLFINNGKSRFAMSASQQQAMLAQRSCNNTKIVRSFHAFTRINNEEQKQQQTNQQQQQQNQNQNTSNNASTSDAFWAKVLQLWKSYLFRYSVIAASVIVVGYTAYIVAYVSLLKVVFLFELTRFFLLFYTSKVIGYQVLQSVMLQSGPCILAFWLVSLLQVPVCLSSATTRCARHQSMLPRCAKY